MFYYQTSPCFITKRVHALLLNVSMFYYLKYPCFITKRVHALLLNVSMLYYECLTIELTFGYYTTNGNYVRVTTCSQILLILI